MLGGSQGPRGPKNEIKIVSNQKLISARICMKVFYYKTIINYLGVKKVLMERVKQIFVRNFSQGHPQLKDRQSSGFSDCDCR